LNPAPLLDNDLDKSPFDQFARWFEEAKQQQPQLPEAMTVSTCGADGIVTSRICLLKSFDEHGFLFYTNYNSRKGSQISENPRVSLCFFWPVLDRQVRVEGVAVKATAEEADAYFATRPRGSQLGAWASEQSQVVCGGRRIMESKYEELSTTYRDRPIPRPPSRSTFSARCQ